MLLFHLRGVFLRLAPECKKIETPINAIIGLGIADYLTINPAATFLAEDAENMGFKTNTASVNFKV